MRFLTTLIAALLFVGSAYAAELACTVPASAVPRAVELCEILRIRMQVPSARWDNDVCATEYLRRGLRDGEAAVTRDVARRAVSDAVHDSLVAFDGNHPAIAPSICGDGEFTTEFGETCDDGNTDPGDGCDEDCQTE